MKPDAFDHRVVCGFRLAKVVVLLSAMLLSLCLFAAGMLRAHEKSRAADRWMTSLDLSLPSLWPSGTRLRHPFAAVPGVDLRYSPHIPGRRGVDIDTLSGEPLRRPGSKP
jgi:hypothetical protein